MDKKILKFIINRYIDMLKLLDYLGLDVDPNGQMFCPFHDNSRTKAAHLYANDEQGPCIFCYAEHRLFTNVDLYKLYLPEVDLEVLAQAIYDRLSPEEQAYVMTNANAERVLPELPYIEALRKFKKREIPFSKLIEEINRTVPHDETNILMDKLYSLPTVKMQDNRNKYLHYINSGETQFKVLSAASVLKDTKDVPDFIIQYLQRNGDCILIPNIIGNTLYSLTFRNIQGKKQFLKIGDISHSLYNLGNLPKDFRYGTPLVLVEGNLDCEAMREVYPYTVASLTASLSTNQIQLISHLTDKVIIAYDDDESGIKGYYSVRKKLTELGMTVKKFNHAMNLHDTGDLFDLRMKDKEEYDYLIRSYRNQIETLI